jgi:hypothetical protein
MESDTSPQECLKKLQIRTNSKLSHVHIPASVDILFVFLHSLQSKSPPKPTFAANMPFRWLSTSSPSSSSIPPPPPSSPPPQQFHESEHYDSTPSSYPRYQPPPPRHQPQYQSRRPQRSNTYFNPLPLSRRNDRSLNLLPLSQRQNQHGRGPSHHQTYPSPRQHAQQGETPGEEGLKHCSCCGLQHTAAYRILSGENPCGRLKCWECERQ